MNELAFQLLDSGAGIELERFIRVDLCGEQISMQLFYKIRHWIYEWRRRWKLDNSIVYRVQKAEDNSWIAIYLDNGTHTLCLHMGPGTPPGVPRGKLPG